MYQSCGAVCECAAEESSIQRLSDERFRVTILPFSHWDGVPSCIMAVIPDGRSSILPHNGEQCLVDLHT